MNTSRTCSLSLALILALGIGASATAAQESELQELNSKVARLYRQGKYAEAVPIAAQAVDLAEATFGSGNANVALTLNNLALLNLKLGKYAEAEPFYQRALDIDEEALGPDHPFVATALNNLASLYQDQGKYAEAEPLYKHSLAIRERALGPDHPDVAGALDNLASLYRDQGKYAEAEPLYQRALAIDEKALGPDHPDVATTLSSLASLYRDRGKYAEAQPLYQRALDIDEKALGPDHRDVATALNNLALLYQDQGKYTEAEPLCQRALRIYEEALGPDHPDVAAALNSLAAIYDHQGNYAEAEPLFRRSLTILEKEFGPDHPRVIIASSNFAALYDDQGKYAEAEPLYRRSLDSLFRRFQYNFSFMTEKDRLAFLDTVADEFPSYFSFVHRYHDREPQLIGSMYNVVLWEKGFIASSIAGMRHQIEASGDKQAIDLLNQLAAKRTQIAALLTVNPPDRDAWRKQVGQLRAEADEIEKALVARSSAFAEKQKLDRATWQQVRDALAPNEAAVEFARFRYYDKKWTDTYYYVALVVTRQTRVEPRYIVLGESKQIEGGALTPFQQSVQTRGLEAQSEATLPGKQAFDLIWKPLEAALAGKTRIYLSPDGALNEIPLGLIPSPDGNLLMERYDLRLVSSTKDILRPPSPLSAATALLVGDPAFELTEDEQRAALEKLALPQPPANLQLAPLSPNDVSRDATGSGSQLPRLPGTGSEVSAIRSIMEDHAWKATLYLQQTALKRVLEQVNGPRVVHLATHGFFLPDQQIKATQPNEPSGLEDPMLRSGLYFAGADRTLAGKPTPEGLDNGVLTAMEAGSLNLSGTELVVLSACNTGRGEVENGERVFGLPRALQEAGAQAVLMSLWSVPDQETQELMRRFYSKWLSGMDMHEAMKEAQLEMREKVKSEHGGHDLPYYWGAFVLVGT